MDKIKLIHTITADDVGKNFITKECPTCGHREVIYNLGFMGGIIERDIGKRIYQGKERRYVVENDEQLKRRVTK